jgi:hypothetical protein
MAENAAAAQSHPPLELPLPAGVPLVGAQPSQTPLGPSLPAAAPNRLPERDHFGQGTTGSDSSQFVDMWKWDGKPQLYGELNEKTNSLSVTYTDSDHRAHTLNVPTLEVSVPTSGMNANTIVPGDYRLGGGRSFYDGGTSLDTKDAEGKWADAPGPPAQHAFGWADTPIRNADGSDGIQAIDKHTGATHIGFGVEVHGGGSALLTNGPQGPFQARQTLEPTEGCVRVCNVDAYNVERMIQKSGGSFPLRVTASERSLLPSHIDGNGTQGDGKPMAMGRDATGSVEVVGDRVVQQLGRGTAAEYSLKQLESAGFDPARASGVMHIGLSKNGEPYVMDDRSYTQSRQQTHQMDLGR